jgi:hypothetical protein
MIISPSRRFIFVHSPKTGGTALSLTLETRAKSDDILIGDTPKAVRRRGRLQHVESAGRLWKHSTLGDIRGLVSDEFIASAFVLTLVRNPWDRMVSYYHWLQVQGFDHPAVALSKALDFKGFVAHPVIAASIRANPYASYVTDAKGDLRCNLFVRIEHFQEEIQPFETHIGFKIGVLLRANHSTRLAGYRGYYNDATAERVAAMASADIVQFGYAF